MPRPAVAPATDGLSNTITYTLDLGGRLTQEQQPGLPAASWMIDDHGQVWVDTDARGEVTTSTYQYGPGEGDLLEVQYPDDSNQQYRLRADLPSSDHEPGSARGHHDLQL